MFQITTHICIAKAMKRVICITVLLLIKIVIVDDNKFLLHNIDNFVFLWNKLTPNLKVICERMCSLN